MLSSSPDTAGTRLPITAYVQASIRIGNIEVTPQILVIDSLIAPVIPGIDFMKRHKVTLDFTVGVHFNGVKLAHQELLQELRKCGVPDVMTKARYV